MEECPQRWILKSTYRSQSAEMSAYITKYDHNNATIKNIWSHYQFWTLINKYTLLTIDLSDSQFNKQKTTTMFYNFARAILGKKTVEVLE